MLFAEFARRARAVRQPRWQCWLDLFRALRAGLHAGLQEAEHCLESAEGSGEAFGWAREGLYGLAMFLIRRDQGRLGEVAPLLELVTRAGGGPRLWRPGLAALCAE
ncbi:MAG: hypothetical protein ACRDKW_07200, partial [Actinomycetota bacterium]